jgi:U3 small nucleolar RNA-associated protein 12
MNTYAISDKCILLINQKEEHVVPETEKGLVTAAGPDGQVLQKDSGRDLAETNWDILLPLGTIKRQSADRVATVKFNSSGTLLGCQVAGKTVEVYRIRAESEMLKKAKRRKKRKRKKTSTKGEDMEGEENVDGDDHEDDAQEILASDMFELSQVVRLKQKLGSFSFSPLQPKKGVIATIALALQNNSLEVYELQEQTSSRIHSIDLPGHRSDVRVTVLSADSTTLMTASHNAVKIWNPRSGTCLRTIESGYGLCGIIVPGNRQAILGTKAGTLEIFDIAAAELIQVVDAHGGAVWSLAPMPDGSGFISGGADHDVKFWEYQLVQSTDKSSKHLSVRNTRLLRMTDDVLCVRTSPDAKYIAVALLDSTIKVFFSDSLKFFVSLYGHKLPVLTMDISSDGALLASGSADKNLKIWGMDFGDCHRSLFAHGDRCSSNLWQFFLVSICVGLLKSSSS